MTSLKFFPLAMFATMWIAGCNTSKEAGLTRKIVSEPWGKTAAGEPVDLYTLTNAKGAEVKITNYGGIVVSIKAPDREGKFGDVVLGFDTLEGYLGRHPHFGALIGRYGNRIGKAKFTLNGIEYPLAKNNGENHLHGGIHAFDKLVWKAKEGPGQSLEVSYLSKDGEEGYPGNLATTVTYTLTDNNELKIDYSATTDKDTIVNLTNHSYFNLAGQGEGDILAHQVTIHADRFTPVDKTLIPTGELRNVEGTPFDFRTPKTIGERIDAKDDQIVIGGGYDHNFVLNRSGASLDVVAKIVEPKTGRVMEVLTTEPGMQLYTANSLNIQGKGGKTYGRRSAFCMETQHHPDSPNKPDFPSAVLKAGARYQTTTVYRFSTM